MTTDTEDHAALRAYVMRKLRHAWTTHGADRDWWVRRIDEELDRRGGDVDRAALAERLKRRLTSEWNRYAMEGER